jgi:hypothetical protein
MRLRSVIHEVLPEFIEAGQRSPPIGRSERSLLDAWVGLKRP